MTNYFKGFGVSFLLHLTVLTLVVCCIPDDIEATNTLLTVDFSAIDLGRTREGGFAGAAERATQEKAAPAPSTAPRPEMKPEPPPETAPDKVAPKPQPQSRPEAMPVKNPVPVKKTAATRQPAPGRMRPALSAATPAASPGDGAVGGRGNETGSGSGRGTGAGSGSGRGQGLSQGYIKTNFNYILARIRRNLVYPSQARRLHLRGIAKISFILKLNGHIEDLELAESSGHTILDEAARKAIQDATPFPPPPAPGRIIIPIKFSLRD